MQTFIIKLFSPEKFFSDNTYSPLVEYALSSAFMLNYYSVEPFLIHIFFYQLIIIATQIECIL